MFRLPDLDFYYDVKRFFSKLLKVIRFLPIVWKHENWDYGYVDKFNLHLHEMLYQGVYTDGHHVANKKHKKALRTIIALYSRLSKDNYDENIHEELEKKYGKGLYDMSTKEIDDRGWHSIIFGYQIKLTPQQQEAFHKDREKLNKQASYLKKQDRTYLYKLINKHHTSFWD